MTEMEGIVNNGRRAFLGLSDSVGIWRVPRLLLAVAAILAMLVSSAGAASASTPFTEPLVEEDRTPSSETALIAMEARMVAERAEEMNSAALRLPSSVADMIAMEGMIAAERAEEIGFAGLMPASAAAVITMEGRMAAEREAATADAAGGSAANPELSTVYWYWYLAEQATEEFAPLLCCAAP